MIHRTRRTWIWAVLLAGLGALLCALPLFGLLGFEFCFVLGIAAAFAGAHLGAGEVGDARAGASRSDGERADARPLRVVTALWGAAFCRGLALLALPLTVVTLNALRVRNCDWPDGLAWFALLPVASLAMGAALGVVAGLASPRGAVAVGLAWAGIVASVAWSAWRFYAAPPIFAYDPFGGYFPGTLYDEEVAIPGALLWARLYHATGALAALAACAAFLDGRRLRLRRFAASSDRRGAALFAAALAAAALLLYGARARLGFQLDADDIARALGGERGTPHFVLHYSPSGPWAKEIDLHAAEHELRYAQLARRLGVEPRVPVHAFLFDSAAQKQALMGAAHTFVAKPWRREIYLQHEPWPHPVLAHELAHVFAGAFGDPLLGIARRGAAINVGLVEGVAVAAAWHGAPLTPHQTVAVLRREGIEPPLARVLSLRFFGLNASQAYAVAGSFCRFLLDAYGPAPLERVYREGGTPAAFAAAYGAPLDALAARWHAVVDAQPLPDEARQLAAERLRRPTVFHKVCAHDLALRRQAAQRAGAAGDRARALDELEAVCADDPDDPQTLADVLEAARAADRPDEVRRRAEQLLSGARTPPSLRARAHVVLGDLALERGELDAARAAYRAAEALPDEEAAARLTTVKRLATETPPVEPGLMHWLVDPPGKRDSALDLYALRELDAAHPERGLYAYLLGRQLVARGRFAEAAAVLGRALAAGLPDARFVREALRQQGIARLRAGDAAGARAAFERLADGAPEGIRLEAADWLERTAASH
jgi:hypothetical protein